MRKQFSILFFCFFSGYVTAQFHELGAFIGGSNYIGDIGTNKYIHPNSPAFGIIYKWNATDRYSLRAGVSISNIKENEFRNDVGFCQSLLVYSWHRKTFRRQLFG